MRTRDIPLAAALWLAGSLPALAFADCATPGYLAVFGEDITATECAIRHAAQIPLTSGPVAIRFISAGGHGEDALWIATANDLLSTIATWADAMGPGLRSAPITVFLADYARDTDAGEHIRGVRLSDSWPGECDIDMYKLTAPPETAAWNFTLAHEIFHCIQEATWPTQKHAPGAKWWIEGTANYFASTVVTDVRPANTMNAFGTQIAGGALFLPDMDYETVVFFDHIAQRGGPEAVATLIAGMPADGDYLSYLQSTQDLTAWSAFAEAYLSNQVTDPGGQTITASTGDPVLQVAEGESGDFALSTDAYRIYRATLTLPAGANYELSVEGSADLRVRASDDRSTWTDLPRTVQTCDGAQTLTVYAVTTTGPQDFHLRAFRQGACSACAANRAADACLIGTWLMTGGGPIEWMRAQGMPSDVQVQASEMSVRMFRNGDYVLNPVTVQIEADNNGNPVTGDGQSVGLSGTWGAGDGQLYICPLSGEISTDIRLSGGERSSMLFGPGGDMQMTYTCSGDTLTTSLQIRRLPPMQTTYTRQGG